MSTVPKVMPPYPKDDWYLLCKCQKFGPRQLLRSDARWFQVVLVRSTDTKDIWSLA